MKVTIDERSLKIDYQYIGKDVTGKEIRNDQEEIVSIVLPELGGSEKQVSWANSIRIKKINSLIGLLDQVRQPGSHRTLLDDFMEQAKISTKQAAYNMILGGAKYNWIIAETSAKEIINKRR